MTWTRQQRHKARAARRPRFRNGGELTQADVDRAVLKAAGLPSPEEVVAAHTAGCPSCERGPIGDPQDLMR